MKWPLRRLGAIFQMFRKHSQGILRQASQRYSNLRAGVIATGLGAALLFTYTKYKFSKASNENSKTLEQSNNTSDTQPGEREISIDELRKHKDETTGIWVTYKGQVNDVTEFAQHHPGGGRLLNLAAGDSLEPFWAIYDFHYKQNVIEILNKYCIGKLKSSDGQKEECDKPDGDPYRNDPRRHPALIVCTTKPFVAEPPLELLRQSFITPNELFFIRNHMPVPNIDENEYCLEICNGLNTVKFSLEDLKTKFIKHKVIATVQCTGNRNRQMKSLREDSIGKMGGAGYISNACWGGARLREVLASAGLNEEVIMAAGLKHIHLQGLDEDLTGTHYAASIPINTAILPEGDVLLAYEMNGKDLPRDHGHPVRCIIPGTTGARQVKWLVKITVSKDESSSFWQQVAYKCVPPSISEKNNEDLLASSPAIQQLPVTSAICEPLEGSRIPRDQGEISICGYAWSGGGRGVIRIDVSIDGGKTWSVAENRNRTSQATGREWAWTLWDITIPLPSGVDELEIVCKAVDRSYNVQPETFEPIWNPRGYLSTAWHRVKVVIDDD